MSKETIDIIEKCNFIISINRNLIDKRNKLKVKHVSNQNKDEQRISRSTIL